VLTSLIGLWALAVRFLRASEWASKLRGRSKAALARAPVGTEQTVILHDEKGYTLLMEILVLCHHDERSRAEAFCEHLAADRYKFNFGLPGFPLGHPRWQKHFLDALERSDAILVVLTAMSLGQRWMNWQIEKAVDAQSVRDIPIYVATLDDQVKSVSQTVTLLQGMKWYPATPNGWLELKSLLQEGESSFTRNLRCFISYSHHRREFATKLCTDLNQANIRTWMDVEGIPGGAVWKQKIAEAIELSTHVLFLLTAESVKSGQVMAEIDWALNKHKTVIPIMEQEVELPFGLVGTQYISFTEGYDAGFRRLLQDLVAIEGVHKAQ